MELAEQSKTLSTITGFKDITAKILKKGS